MVNKIRCILVVLLVPFLLSGQHNVIPEPVSYEARDGVFNLSQFVLLEDLTNSNKSSFAIESLCLALKDRGTSLDQKHTSADSKIVFEIISDIDQPLGEEGYIISVADREINIKAKSQGGLLYAVQTIKQLITKKSINNCKVIDYPRFGWRGLMLDVSRNFRNIEEVKHFIDNMAFYKYNLLHFHLTDDQGWRIEIKSHPKLTEIGGCRVPRMGLWNEREAPKEGEKATDCDFYTQDQIRDLINYARERNVEIMPEIDVPGHSMAAIAAYGDLSTTQDSNIKVSPGSKFSKWYGAGKFEMFIDNTLDPTSEKVYSFLDDVFGEIADLFPHPYIHMGGDEAYHGYWEKSSKTKSFMIANDIGSTHELQSYFVKRVEKIINSKGKKLIGWDEILDGGLAPNATVMSWRGMKGGIEAAKLGHKVVMTPNTHAYIDLYQGDPTVEPKTYSRLYLKSSYDWDPIPPGIDESLILGGQGNLWAERFSTYRHLQYMAFPRAWALSEVYWSPKENKNWENFVFKMEKHFDLNDEMSINYSKAAYDPIITVSSDAGKVFCSIKCDIPNTQFYYTMDNSLPDQFSKPYKSIFSIPNEKLTLRVVSYKNGVQSGRIISLDRDEIDRRSN